MSKPKSCPFCGSNDVYYEVDVDDFGCVVCHGCWAQGPKNKAVGRGANLQSITDWNRREPTMDRWSCKLVPTRDKPRSKVPTLTCSECGWWTEEIGKAWNYCPSCGRRVIG